MFSLLNQDNIYASEEHLFIWFDTESGILYKKDRDSTRFTCFLSFHALSLWSYFYLYDTVEIVSSDVNQGSCLSLL